MFILLILTTVTDLKLSFSLFQLCKSCCSLQKQKWSFSFLFLPCNKTFYTFYCFCMVNYHLIANLLRDDSCNPFGLLPEIYAFQKTSTLMELKENYYYLRLRHVIQRCFSYPLKWSSENSIGAGCRRVSHAYTIILWESLEEDSHIYAWEGAAGLQEMGYIFVYLREIERCDS